jgi:DNA-binding LacI/PurR family transcriptional regulator
LHQFSIFLLWGGILDALMMKRYCSRFGVLDLLTQEALAIPGRTPARRQSEKGRIAMEVVPRKTTIRDVAQAASVGIGTISRVLNSSSQVSRETRARVLEAIRRLGFRPNAQARRILKRRTEMVCFLLSNRDFLHPFHARILQGVESYATSLKQHVLFAALHYSPRTPPDRIDLPPVLQEHGLIDGLILAGTIYPNLLGRIESIHMPFVAFSNNVVGMGDEQQFDQVGFDDFNGTLHATRYLIGKGHRQIVFAGDTSYPWLHHRFEGYRQGMREKKLKSILIMARNAQSFVDFGQKSVGRILSRQPRPTAVVAGNDEIAYGLWRSLQRHAMKVPDDISLVGFDDREEAVLMDPQLSTVRVHKEEIGETCVKMLLERLHHPQMAFSQRILPTEFVIRGTVRNLPA